MATETKYGEEPEYIPEVATQSEIHLLQRLLETLERIEISLGVALNNPISVKIKQ